MRKKSTIATVVVLAATVFGAVQAHQAPDFWYLVPDASQTSVANRSVRGIVIPTAVPPAVHAGPEGSVVSWTGTDGSRRSLVVKGLSSLALEPGPMSGTTYVPFGSSRRLSYDPDRCCICASWRSMVESFEQLTCVAGCDGCGCEACICSPTSPCPESARKGMTLVAHDDPATVLTIDPAGEIDVARRGRSAVRFRGGRLSAGLSRSGRANFSNPDSITIPGRVSAMSAVRGDAALFAWSSPDASVIVEQPRSFPPPSIEGGTIDLGPRPGASADAATSKIAIVPVADRCRVCGWHPNSTADLDLFECVPGAGDCYRCISWECLAPEL